MPEPSPFSTDEFIYTPCRKLAPRLCGGVLRPNEITVLGVAPALVAVAGVLARDPFVAVAGIILRHVCDCLDGSVARACGETSEFGRLLDHWTDAAFAAGMVAAFWWVYVRGRVPWPLVGAGAAGLFVVGKVLWSRWATAGATTDAVHDHLLLLVLLVYGSAVTLGNYTLKNLN
jgi:phosphatidylglycerophosphate synthase